MAATLNYAVWPPPCVAVCVALLLSLSCYGRTMVELWLSLLGTGGASEHELVVMEPTSCMVAVVWTVALFECQIGPSDAKRQMSVDMTDWSGPYSARSCLTQQRRYIPKASSLGVGRKAVQYHLSTIASAL